MCDIDNKWYPNIFGDFFGNDNWIIFCVLCFRACILAGLPLSASMDMFTERARLAYSKLVKDKYDTKPPVGGSKSEYVIHWVIRSNDSFKTAVSFRIPVFMNGSLNQWLKWFKRRSVVLKCTNSLAKLKKILRLKCNTFCKVSDIPDHFSSHIVKTTIIILDDKYRTPQLKRSDFYLQWVAPWQSAPCTSLW